MIDSIRMNMLLATVALLALVLVGCDRITDTHDEAPGASAAAGADAHDHAGEAVAEDDHDDEGVADDGHDDHDDEGVAGDGHAATDDEAADDHDHADDGATGAPDAAAHGDEHVELTPGERERLDLRLATAEPGTIEITAEFPGEVVLDPGRMAHIVPRAAGIVREVGASLGDLVEAGEILAWLESDELAKAKLAFYARHAELAGREVELPRRKEIFESTDKMLALLETEPSVEELQQLDALEMGEHRGALVTAYAEYLAAQRVFERERDLYGKNISSESEFVAAEAALKKAQAAFTAAKDVARYQVLIGYSAAARARQIAELEVVAAEQSLRLMGVDDEVLVRLLALVPPAGSLEPCPKDDPDCVKHAIPSVIEMLGVEPRLGWYALRAPFAGFITEKHLTLGEKTDGSESVFTIADTSTVWVRFNVYQKDLGVVQPGQGVRIDLGVGSQVATGTISYVAPIVDRQTRTAPARLELENPEGAIRPGLYAAVHVNVAPLEGSVVVPKSAVQVLGEEDVIFVPEGDDFVAAPVRLGRSDHQRVIILDGLPPGQRYVAQGGFELKAKIVTSGAGAHAGHGH